MGDSTSIWALVIAIAAAGFTGWQALITHLDRASRRKAHLRVLGLSRSELDGPTWLIENIGEGAATDVRVVARIVASPTREVGAEFHGRVLGAVAGGSSVPIEPTGNSWPPALNEYRDYPGVLVWAGGRARVEWMDVGGKKRSKDIAMTLPY